MLDYKCRWQAAYDSIWLCEKVTIGDLKRKLEGGVLEITSSDKADRSAKVIEKLKSDLKSRLAGTLSDGLYDQCTIDQALVKLLGGESTPEPGLLDLIRDIMRLDSLVIFSRIFSPKPVAKAVADAPRSNDLSMNSIPSTTSRTAKTSTRKSKAD